MQWVLYGSEFEINRFSKILDPSNDHGIVEIGERLGNPMGPEWFTIQGNTVKASWPVEGQVFVSYYGQFSRWIPGAWISVEGNRGPLMDYESYDLSTPGRERRFKVAP